jgi:hypothetical protein
MLIVTNPKPSDNYFNRLWQNERGNVPCSFRPIEMLWYEKPEFEIPKLGVKKIFKLDKEELKKWGY